MPDVEVPREDLPTKLQIRMKLGQKDRWLEAARAAGVDLSTWIRDVCDATAAAAGPTPPGPTLPRPTQGEEAAAVGTERSLPNPADTARDPTPDPWPLADNCINGDYHWRLHAGERCTSCGGTA